jgi:ribosome-associated protein
MKVRALKSKKIADLAITALDDLKGEQIRSINVEKLTSITDYMVIVTGRSNTHVKAMADAVVVKAKEAGLGVSGVEGKMQSEWVLVDLGGVVVHIMMAPVRALYNLEDLWSFQSDAQDVGEDDSSPGAKR